MELIDRYVKDVSRRLPQKRRADVEWELHSAIMDALDGRGARTDDDVIAVLREFGDPATVAAGYAPERQYLIGPELYPVFLRVLNLVLMSVGALCVLWFAVQLAIGRAEPMAAGDELIDTIALGLRAAFMAAVVVTATFIVMQRSGDSKRREKRAWDPRTLPQVMEVDRVNRLEAGFSLVVLAIALAIVGAIGHEASAGLNSSPSVLRPLIGGALIEAIPWLIASILVEALMQAGLLIEGRQRIWWRALHVASDGLAVIAFGISATAVFAHRAALRSLGMPDGAVTALGLFLVFIAAAIAWGAVKRERKLARRRAEESERPVPAPPVVMA